MKEKVLITGCAGFIGSHLSSFFLKKGAIVIGVDNLSRKGSKLNLNLLLGNKNFYFNKADIRSFPKLVSIFKKYKRFNLIIHEASQVAVTTSVLNPREDFEVNALGTFNILEATRLFSANSFFQFASTNKVYGNIDSMKIIDKGTRYEYRENFKGFNENTNLDFHSPYGCSKGAADQYVRDYSRIYGLKTVVLRQSCIYGTRQYGVEDQGWLAWFIIAALLGKPITIYGNGKQVRDILWIDDLIDAYFRLYKNKDKVSGEIFNVGGGLKNSLSLLELIEILKKERILKNKPTISKWRPGDQKIFIANTQKIKKAIGWKATIRPAQGIRKLIRWFLDNRSLLEKTFK